MHIGEPKKEPFCHQAFGLRYQDAAATMAPFFAATTPDKGRLDDPIC
jgi:hypothetical protein